MTMTMQFQLTKVQLSLKDHYYFFFLPLPFPFSLYEILPLQPRGGESAIRSISLWWSGLGVMMPRV